MKPELDAILDDCLARLEAGESVQSCLTEYPDQAETLHPLLAAAAFVKKTPAPRARPDAFLAGQQRMLQAGLLQQRANPELTSQKQKEEFHEQAVSFRPLLRYVGRVGNFLKTLLIGKEQTKMKLALRLAIDLVVILVIGSVMTVNASANSLPGDPTYGVKRAWEQVRLTFTLDPQAQQELERYYAEERLGEIEALRNLGRQGEVELKGVLQTIDGDRWTVNGLVIQVTPATARVGSPALGQTVEVKARVQSDGTLVAMQVKVDDHASQEPGHGLEPSHTPAHTASPSRTPAPTQMPEPTHAPTDHPAGDPSHTPDAEHEPTETHMPAPSSTPAPVHDPDPTHEPTHESRPTDQPEPTHKTEPTHEPDPTQAPEPTHHVEPTNEPEPTHESEPTHEPEPTNEPEPAHEPEPTHHPEGDD